MLQLAFEFWPLGSRFAVHCTSPRLNPSFRDERVPYAWNTGPWTRDEAESLAAHWRKTDPTLTVDIRPERAEPEEASC